MSMLSAQCAELRDKAKLLRGHADGLKAPYVIPSTKELMMLTMLDSATRMEEAADTIISLRDRLQAVELGSGTCEMVTSGTPCDGNTDVACTSCGAYNIGEYYDGHGHRSSPKYCPECGARRVER